jgi:hypothetical protein
MAEAAAAGSAAAAHDARIGRLRWSTRSRGRAGRAGGPGARRRARASRQTVRRALPPRHGAAATRRCAALRPGGPGLRCADPRGVRWPAPPGACRARDARTTRSRCRLPGGRHRQGLAQRHARRGDSAPGSAVPRPTAATPLLSGPTSTVSPCQRTRGRGSRRPAPSALARADMRVPATAPRSAAAVAGARPRARRRPLRTLVGRSIASGRTERTPDRPARTRARTKPP